MLHAVYHDQYDYICLGPSTPVSAHNFTDMGWEIKVYIDNNQREYGSCQEYT